MVVFTMLKLGLFPEETLNLIFTDENIRAVFPNKYFSKKR
jgi:hypothetical protein